MELELIDESTQKTIALIESLNKDKAVALPEKGWSALQVLEHVVLVERSIFGLLMKPRTFNAAIPATNLGAQKLKQILIDSRETHKATSPEAFEPKGLFNNLEQVKTAFLDNRIALRKAIADGTLKLDGAQFKHPRFGEMTVRDWLHFLAFHNERHLHQIEDVIKTI